MINAIKELDNAVQSIVAKIKLIEDKLLSIAKVDQEQSKKIDAIYKELNTIKNENKSLKAEIKALKSKK